MCGIAGIFFLNNKGAETRVNHTKVLNFLRHRGPDNQTYKAFKSATLFHSRLSIVDPSSASNQPFTGQSSDEALVFNGEIFNYRSLQQNLSDLKTTGDTEVLFEMARLERKDCLNQLNGFFSFAYYNASQHYLFIARDRLGVKPLYYYKDDHKFAFASELKPLLELSGPCELNENEIYSYLRLNYCAGHETIFKNVFKLLPGHCIEIINNVVTIQNWYVAPRIENKNTLADLLEDAVKVRLHADVPLGTFLSGGLDSSIISAIAKKHKPDLKTFSLGFEHDNYFDETRYSEIVARHINSEHHVFKLNEDDFLNNIDDFLAGIDEPFADASAFNFYMLCKYTKQHVKVALSGDGADELFKGYHKHRALFLSEHIPVKLLAKLSAFLPVKTNSRHGKFQNKIRQLKKFNTLVDLPKRDRQKFLASVTSNTEAKSLMKHKVSSQSFEELFKTNASFEKFNIEDSFDLQTVLTDDMLVKADRFSMQHGIEIRNPFLDYRVVEFALNLPLHEKINNVSQKIILKNDFKNLLPPEIITRPKKGFELPLQRWLTGKLSSKVNSEWLNKEKIDSENIFNYSVVESLIQQITSAQAGDSAAQVWAIIVFESWLHNFKDYIKH